MALVDCPDCGTEISTRAAACPECGAPQSAVSLNTKSVRHENEVNIAGEIFRVEEVSSHKVDYRYNMFVLVAFCAFLTLISAYGIITGENLLVDGEYWTGKSTIGKFATAIFSIGAAFFFVVGGIMIATGEIYTLTITLKSGKEIKLEGTQEAVDTAARSLKTSHYIPEQK